MSQQSTIKTPPPPPPQKLKPDWAFKSLLPQKEEIMTEDEAIKELQHFNIATFETYFITFKKAINLGIEALKRVKEIREGSGRFQYRDPLPGETKK